MTTFTREYLEANKGPQTLAIIIIFPCISTIIVGLRLYTRFGIINRASHEDYAMLAALIFSIATSICQGYQVYNGMGRHVQTLTLAQGIGSLKALFASIMLYNFGLTLTKLSILFQYLRITIDVAVQKVCKGFLYFVLANCVQTFFTGTLSCYPVAKFWDDRIPGSCVNKPALWYANAAMNIIQDIILMVLPIFILRKLVLPRREKISLILVLGLGGVASVASVLRLHALYIVAISQDITWDNPGTATWSTMELNIGIICASLPTLNAFLAKHFPGVFTSSLVSAQRISSVRSGDRHLIHGIIQLSGPTDNDILVQREINDRQDTDIEKAEGTFLASDSDVDIVLQQPKSARRA